jgi:hypothetical protein
MIDLEYNSESREWYIASGLILFVTVLCYSFLSLYVLPEQSEILPVVANAIHLSFALLGLSGLFLAVQGYRLKNSKGFILRKDGDEILYDLERLFLDAGLSVKEVSCVNMNSVGLWRPVGRLILSEGEIEVKEIWLYAYYYRTHVALRGKVPDKIIKKFASRLV